MKIQFRKQYYNETAKNENGEDAITNKTKTMYQMRIAADYFTENKQEVVKQAIADLRNKANELEKLYNRNEKAQDSWDSISK